MRIGEITDEGPDDTCGSSWAREEDCDTETIGNNLFVENGAMTHHVSL